MTDALAQLSEAGVSIWLDDLSRERLVSGSLADLGARDHVVGVTTNPAIFAKAIAGGDAYGPQIRDLSARGTMPEATLRAVAGHGQVPADSIHGHYDEAQQVLSQLRAAGIGYEDIMQGLEDDAVARFDAVWQRLGDQLAATLLAQPARQHRS